MAWLNATGRLKSAVQTACLVVPIYQGGRVGISLRYINGRGNAVTPLIR
ncbi:hypothetical protein [Neisseria animaloris]|nr:hypothetical protein [Neisseria animaloris]